MSSPSQASLRHSRGNPRRQASRLNARTQAVPSSGGRATDRILAATLAQLAPLPRAHSSPQEATSVAPGTKFVGTCCGICRMRQMTSLGGQQPCMAFRGWKSLSHALRPVGGAPRRAKQRARSAAAICGRHEAAASPASSATALLETTGGESIGGVVLPAAVTWCDGAEVGAPLGAPGGSGLGTAFAHESSAKISTKPGQSSCLPGRRVGKTTS
jgi:hypothetical protein